MTGEPFEALRAAGAEILATQHAREPGAAAALFDETARGDHGEALRGARSALDLLDPTPPAPSEAVTADLLRAAEFIQTAADGGERREAVRLWRAALDPPPPAPPAPVAVRNVTGDPPAPVLSIPRHDGRRDGAVLSVGTVGLLAGAGGAAKTTLALQIAVAAAATPDGAAGEACGGALIVADGPVVVATYEDALPVLRDRVLRMVERGAHLADGLDRLHLLDLAGWPLYGPADGMGYSAPPSPAGGWAPLWAAVEATGARLVIVDPALAAFTGESNAAGPVRAFIGALAREAAKRRAAVLLIAHSSKAARGKDRGKDADPYDPGQIGGSSHWADGARGALSLTRDAAAPDRHRLAIVKANYGPSMVSTDLAAARTPGGALVGLDARDGATWQHGAPATAGRHANGAASGKVGADIDTSEV